MRRPQTIEVFQQCRNLYARALSIDPEDYESNFNMGVLLYENKKDIDKAIHYFKVAINEDANPTALFNLAVIYDERGERQDAKRTYMECLKVDCNHFKSNVNIAIILEKEG
jgi:tetratricopeptide (TPR) repeat protein